MRLLAVLVVLLVAALWFLGAGWFLGFGDEPESAPTNLTAAEVRGTEDGEDRVIETPPLVAESAPTLRVEIDDESAPAADAEVVGPGAIEVVVIRPDGSRAEGAEVILEAVSRSGRSPTVRSTSKPTRGTTNAEGRCELAAFDGQLYALFARAPGMRSPRTTPVVIGDHITLRLEPDAALFGFLVAAEDRRPIGNALLLLESDGVISRTSTAADGSFRWPTQRSTALRLEILAAGFERLRTRITPSTEPHTIELMPDKDLTGHVVRRGDRAALADVQVDAIVRRKVGEERVTLSLGSTRTGADGSFTLRGLPEDGFELLASSASARGGLEIEDAVQGALTIELGTGAAVAGTIRFADGAAASGATVALIGLSAFDATTRKTKSDPNGSFVLPHCPVDRPFEIVVYASGTTPQVMQLSAVPSAPLEIVLLPMNRLLGSVRDTSGQPLGSAAVELAAVDPLVDERLRAARSPAAAKLARTRADGRFAFESLPPGDYRVRVDDRRGGSDWVDVTVAPAADVEVDLLANRSVTLRGRVISREGLPIASATIEVTTRDRSAPRICRSREDGSFDLSALASGYATLEVDAEGFSPASSELILPYALGNGEIVIELTAAPTVRGRVVDGRTRAPISSFSLRVDAEAEGDRTTVAKQSIEDRAGEFVLADLPEGELTLFVRAPGYFSAGPFPIRTSSHAPLVIELASAAEVEGHVLGPAKAAMPGVRVFVRQLDAPNAGKLTSTHTKADGSFRARDLQPGRVEIGVGDPDRPALVLPAREITYGRNDVGDLPLSGTGTIEISLRNAEAFSHHVVTLRGRTTKTKLDLDAGSSGLRAGPLLPDTYVLEIASGSKREVALSAEATVKVEFDLK